jgi:hypothetical protein
LRFAAAFRAPIEAYTAVGRALCEECADPSEFGNTESFSRGKRLLIFEFIGPRNSEFAARSVSEKSSAA